MLFKNLVRISLYLMAVSVFPSVYVEAQTLTVQPGVTALTIHPGDNNIPLPVTLGSTSYSGPISVTVTGLPSGITVAPLTLFAGGSGTLQLSATIDADLDAFPPIGPTESNTAETTVSVLAFSGSLEATADISLTVSLTNPTFAPAPNAINLLKVMIDTGGVGITSQTVNTPGTITITSADGTKSYLPGTAGSDDTATFHIHGNSSAVMPKKPYNVKLNTSIDLMTGLGVSCGYETSKNAAVCDKAKSYILLANYDDKSLLRDWSASALALSIPIGSPYLAASTHAPTPTTTPAWWAPHSLFVELYIDGQYEGNYQIIEKVDVDSHKVNVNEIADTDTASPAVTGGYLMEIDQRQDEDYNFITPERVKVGMDVPDFTPEVPEQETYISDYVDSAEAALFGPNYTDPILGWPGYFDEATAVDFYIVNDLMGNSDGGDFYSSDYFYKDINNPLIYMGPVWDFDISAGNVNYETIQNPTVTWMSSYAPWYKQWFTDPHFKAAVAQQWNALQSNNVLSTWLASIQTMSSTLQQTQANNFSRWPMQGVLVWPNAFAPGSYNGEISNLVAWLELRMGFLNATLNTLLTTQTVLTTSAPTISSGAPLILNAHVTGAATSPGGVVTFALTSVEATVNTFKVIGQGTVDNTGMASLTISNLPSGSGTMRAIYNGDATHKYSNSATVAVTVSNPLVETMTNLETSGTDVNPGTSVALTATVIQTLGTAVPTGTVTFSSNSAPLQTVMLSNGEASINTTSLPLGTDEIQVTYNGNPSDQLSASNIVDVVVTTSPPLDSLQVAGFPKADTIGAAQTVTVTAYDTNNAVMTSFTGTVSLTSSDPAASLPAAYTFVAADAGVHTFTVTLNTGGTQSITATSGNISGSETGIDVGDFIWLVNANGTLAELDYTGATVISGVGTASGTATFGGIAFDHAGNLWSVTSATNSLFEASPTGSSPTTYSGGGLHAPASIAIDGNGYVWIANSNSISSFNVSGTPQSPTAGYAATDLSSPSSIAIDASGSLWITNAGSDSVTHVFGGATPVVTPIAAAVTNATLGTKP